MFEDIYFAEETLSNSEFHLNDVDIQINKNYITKFDKHHIPKERMFKSTTMQIIGFNGDNKVTIDIDGNFKVSVE